MKKIFNIFFCLLLGSSLAGCMSLQKHHPLTFVPGEDAYTFNNILANEGGVGDNLMVITLSGGGTRAGSLAYGVMQGLEQVRMPGGGSLLDETKVISSVSGGSFASAFYGLYGKEKFFRAFKRDVLRRSLSSRVLIYMLRVFKSLPIALSSDLGRTEVAQEIYDNLIYDEKTFADMPRRWPFIVMNSTDMTLGVPFSFTQEDFNKICYDLDKVKIARAVAASSAFPGPFNPIVLKNYPKELCGYAMPEWAATALAGHPELDPQTYFWASNLRTYMNSKKRKYVHAFDGGVADNLGVRPLLYAFQTGQWNVFDENQKMKARRVIMITVDAKPAESLKADQKAKNPSFSTVILNAATKPLRNYTIQTAQEMQARFRINNLTNQNYQTIQRLCDQVYAESDKEARAGCYAQFAPVSGSIHQPPYPEFYFVHVQFENVTDPKLRTRLGKVRTDLQLENKEIDLVVSAGRDILFDSPNFQKLVMDLGATIDPDAPLPGEDDLEDGE